MRWMLLNRRGSSDGPRSAAAVALARALNDNLGDITDRQFTAARSAGLGDGEVMEVIALVALNIFTNLIGKATQIDIDFPRVSLLSAA